MYGCVLGMAAADWAVLLDNQGARLTAFELVYEKIPSTLIADSVVSALMKEKGANVVPVALHAGLCWMYTCRRGCGRRGC